jgi:hypothetical protein
MSESINYEVEVVLRSEVDPEIIEAAKRGEMAFIGGAAV